MKTLKFFNIGLALLIGLTACSINGQEGPPGPAGPAGPPGPAGPVTVATTFEYEGVSFQPPSYDVIFGWPQDFEYIESDVVLAYILESTLDDGSPVWRALPLTVFDGTEDIYSYNYDFSQADIRFFMEANFDLSLLLPEETNDFLFRAVVVPADYYTANARSAIDFSNYNEVAQHFNINEDDIVKRK